MTMFVLIDFNCKFQVGSSKDDDGDGSSASASSDLPTFDIGSKLAELKQTRQLGSQITNKVSKGQIDVKSGTLQH